MEVPVGFLAKLWSFLSFLPFFVLLFFLGLVKAAIIGPITVGIMVIGNSAVIVGLWIAHLIWTYYCVAKTKRLGLVLKIVVLILLPVPLVLWPVIGIFGSLLGGIGYGFFSPLVATFEAVGESIKDKCYHCFFDGTFSTIKGSCTVVRDLTDFCFHSYFSYMDKLSERISADEKPMDVKLFKLPSCVLVILMAVPVDMLLITSVTLWKSPYMLFIGWKRLLEDMIGREGPFLETVCVPFAGLAIILWPLAVVGAVIGAIISSFFLGLYSGVIVHQEGSLLMGFGYIIAVVSLFDEYVNDLLYLREGSCLPRPRYRKNTGLKPGDQDDDVMGRKEKVPDSKLVSQKSRTLKEAIQQYKLVQVWDWLFKSCEVNGRILLRDGLITISDIEEYILKGDSKKLSIKLPTWSILQCLLVSAKSDSSGLVISEDIELTGANGPGDRVFDWFIEPLLIMKEQIKKLQLDENEEICLRRLVPCCGIEKPEDWDECGFPSNDSVRRAQLQAIIRRLQGIVASMSRMPTFRRRFRNLVKMLYIEAIQAGASDKRIGGILDSKYIGTSLIERENREDGEESEIKAGHEEYGSIDDAVQKTGKKRKGNFAGTFSSKSLFCILHSAAKIQVLRLHCLQSIKHPSFEIISDYPAGYSTQPFVRAMIHHKSTSGNPKRAFSVASRRSASLDKITDDHLTTNKTPQSTVTCVYQTHIAGYWRNVTVLWCRNLMNHSLSLMINSLEGEVYYTFKIDLKPWLFWTKKGNKSFDLEGCQIDIHWDLRSAKYTGSPEPYSDYYVAMVSEEEVVLLLGDYKKKAYKRTKARPALVDGILFYKKENVFARKTFTSRARFDEKGQEHDIVVESSTTGPQDPEMWISIDGIVVIHVKNLQWKFRGNQTVTVNKQPVQVFWDVHDWLFNSPGAGHGFFIFKPGPQESEDDKDGSGHGSGQGAHSDTSDGSRYFSTRSYATTNDFCLYLYAWKME